MGITTPLDGIPAEGIGGLRLGVTPLELTDAYATLAAGGIHRKPVSIEKVTFPNGHVDKPQAAKPERVLTEAVAYEVTKLLHDNITEGTGTAAYTGCAGQAGKTGTTDEYTDAWFSGYQPNLATAVWVGYPESNDISMSSVHGITVFGGTFPAEIWHSLYSNGGVPCEEFERPAQPISWAPYYGHFTQASPSDTVGGSGKRSNEPPPPGSAAVGGYDPNEYNPDAYAPGAGQEPAPLPPAPPSVGGGGASAGDGSPGRSG
jgi:penicillin-binding protein 1A